MYPVLQVEKIRQLNIFQHLDIPGVLDNVCSYPGYHPISMQSKGYIVQESFSHFLCSATNLITKPEKSRRYETKQQFPLNE